MSKVEHDPSLRIWTFNGGAPWVVAPSAMEAAELLQNSDAGGWNVEDLQNAMALAGDKPFTMMWDDIPDDLAPLSDCDCERDEWYASNGCDCGQSNSATFTVAEWLVKHLRHLTSDGPVIGEYEG